MNKKLIFPLLLIILLISVPFVQGYTNYADIPTAWGGYNTYGDIRFTSVNPPSDNQITSYDTTVEHTTGEGSVQIAVYETGSENTAREANTGGIAIVAGDNVTFTCWMKTADNTSTARIGVDFYYGATRITAKQSTGNLFYPIENDALVVANRVNDTEWRQRTLEFTVPTTLTADGYSGFTNNTVHSANYMVAWMQGEVTDGCTVWFADAELTIVHNTAYSLPGEPAGWNSLYFLLGLGAMLFVLYVGVIKKK